MEVKYRRYTKDSDDVIMQYVNRYPYNLSHAFRCAAFHMNRTAKGIEQHYYKYLYQRPHQNESVKPKTSTLKETPKGIINITVGKYSISISENS